MKYFVFSDVHGFYTLLQNELNKKGFDENNDNHMLISIGDNFDRGPENYEMFMFLKRMKEKNKIILIRGNHEDLLLQVITSRRVNETDYTNGTYKTIEDLSVAFFGDEKKNIFFEGFPTFYWALKEEGFLDLIYNMANYYETNHFVFTHGFIPVNDDLTYNSDWRNSSEKEFYKSRWLNGIKCSIYHKLKEPNKKIVVGHYRTSYGNVRKEFGKDLPFKDYRMLEYSNFEYFNIYEDENLIAIDGCITFSKKVNILVIDD